MANCPATKPALQPELAGESSFVSQTALPAFLLGAFPQWIKRHATSCPELCTLPTVDPPWCSNAVALTELVVVVNKWLEALGWTAIGDATEQDAGTKAPRAKAPNRTTTHEQHLQRFTASSASLSVLVVSPTVSLDFPELRKTHKTTHEPSFEQTLLSQGDYIGIMTNGRELRVCVRDARDEWHCVGATSERITEPFLRLAEPPKTVITKLCLPSVVTQANRLALALSEFRATRLTALSQKLVVAQTKFLCALLNTEGNRDKLDAIADPTRLSSALWQESLLCSFALLLVARLELGRRHRRVLGQHAERCGMPLGFAIDDLALHLGPDGSARTRQGGAQLVVLARRLLDFVRARFSEPTQPVLEQCGNAGGLSLDELEWPIDETAWLIHTVLLDVPNHPLESASRIPSLLTYTTFELSHLFESFVEFEPHIAQEPMVRRRKGKYEVVVAVKSASAPESALASGTGRHKRRSTDEQGAVVEHIPQGHFYLSRAHGRKLSGAFYTPPAIAEALGREALSCYLDPGTLGRWSRRPLALLDPAMGAGAFLLSAAQLLGYALFECLRKNADAESESVDLQNHAELLELYETAKQANTSNELIRLRAQCCAHCAISSLYGIDKNPIAVTIARLTLFAAHNGDERVAAAVRQHLVCGDSLTGPRLPHLMSLPNSRAMLPAEHQGAIGRAYDAYRTAKLNESRAGLINRCKHFDTFEPLAALWAGAVLIGTQAAEDVYVRVVQELLTTHTIDVSLMPQEAIEVMNKGRHCICFEAKFPERFEATANAITDGFELVLGNPPWDSVKYATREYLAPYDLRAHSASTKTERDEIVDAVHSSQCAATALEHHLELYEELKRAHDRVFSHQKIVIDGDLAGRQLDLFRLFIERAWSLVCNQGVLGFVVPSAFHTAAGAVGVRRLLLESGHLHSYAVLDNSRRWFDVSPGLEFGLLVGKKCHKQKDAVTRFRFGLNGPESLNSRTLEWLQLPRWHLERNAYATIPGVSDQKELETLLVLQEKGTTFAEFAKASHLEMRSTPTTVHRTHEAKYFVELPEEDRRQKIPSVCELRSIGAILHEGSTFARFNDSWAAPPSYAISPMRLEAVPRYRTAIGHYRLVMRAIVGTSPHKGIAAIVAPGTLVANSALVEGTPELRPSYQALLAMAVLNSSITSFLLSTSADLNINLFALRRMAWPRTLAERFVAHGALRLIANHQGFEPLVREQLGGALSDSRKFTYPMVAHADERRRLHCQLDAAVAHAFELTRSEYGTVLARFDKDRTYADALYAFDELSQIGAAIYEQKHDPFDTVPLVTTTPKPILCLREDQIEERTNPPS